MYFATIHVLLYRVALEAFNFLSLSIYSKIYRISAFIMINVPQVFT